MVSVSVGEADFLECHDVGERAEVTYYLIYTETGVGNICTASK